MKLVPSLLLSWMSRWGSTQAGTKLSKQDPPTKTANGWYTIVTTDDEKTRGFVYVRQVGKSWLVCDTLVSRGDGDDRPTVLTEKLVEICDSAELP